MRRRSFILLHFLRAEAQSGIQLHEIYQSLENIKNNQILQEKESNVS